MVDWFNPLLHISSPALTYSPFLRTILGFFPGALSDFPPILFQVVGRRPVVVVSRESSGPEWFFLLLL